MTPLPPLLIAGCFRPSWRVGGTATTPRGPLPGRGSRGRTEAAEPEGRVHGGRPPHFLRLPGGGAISAYWARAGN